MTKRTRLPALTPIPPPLQADPDGTLRVGDTRVTLDTLIAAFRAGATPEEIVARYPTLRLADTYAAIAYYLQSTADVDAYLAARHAEAAALRADLETHFDPAGIRDRLLARLTPPADDALPS